MSTPCAKSIVRPLEERLAAYGCSDVIRLDGKLSDPAQLEYLDLLPTQAMQTPALTAVAEHQGTALLYLLDACGDAKSDAKSLATVRQQLANRSDPAWLGVIKSGSLEIYPIGFHEAAGTGPIRTIEEHWISAPQFFQSLVHGTFEDNDRMRGTDYVFQKIFNLLTQTTNEFVPKEGNGRLDALEVLSMAGRALFFRFLIDRCIVLENERAQICPAAAELHDAFSTAEKAAQTSAWLDKTFNGDFLPLINESIPADNRAAREQEYLRFYQHTEHLVGKTIFDHLQAIIRGWRAVGGDFQPELDWGDLDFAHIPVGVLSQVYESFSHRADPRTAHETSVHYTPRTIAGLMVNQAFAAVEDTAAAHVLDPACGAGIFLVLAFRRLLRERWQHDEVRPNKTVIQEILYDQLCGFDVSESALRLAALALYITAIELNGSPRPPHELKFPRNLRGTVLYRFGGKIDDAGKPDGFELGSLGTDVSSEFDKRFDVVIGNPPWTRVREGKHGGGAAEDNPSGSLTGELNQRFTSIGRQALAARGFADLAKRYENPDNNPDLPFLWRATEWAKKDGVIALAMPARLFGRTTGRGFEAWRAVLRSLAVTGLLNGADLRKTAVWDGVDMPFCLFFARNAVPGADHRFQYAAPLYEPEPNGRGRFRIDYAAAQPISSAHVEQQPWLLKTLSLGTWLDVEVMEALKSSSFKTLGEVWRNWDERRKRTGQGFNRSPGLKQKYVDFLAGLRVFKPTKGFSIEYTPLKKYGDLFGKNVKGQSSAHWSCREEMFQPPLVILPKAPGEDPCSAKAYLSSEPLAFSQSFYGYSCKGHSDGATLASLIYLLAHSLLFRYFALMVSVSQGADHMIFTKQDFDDLPFPRLEELPDSVKTSIRTIAHRLEHDTVKPWQELDSLIFRLYGLDEDAVQVAKDTIFASVAYRKAGQVALKPTTRDSSDRNEPRAAFVKTLQDELEPYFDVCGEHAAVREAQLQHIPGREPWIFLAVSREADTVPVNASLMRKAMDLATQQGASRIMVNAPGGRGALLGLLDQRRWWTVTRARLCAQYIILNHLGAFGLPAHA